MPRGQRQDHVRAQLTRRSLLRAAALCTAFSSSAIGLVGSRYGSGRSQRLDRYPFKLGIASGDPAADGVVLWTRLAPEPLEGGGMAPFAVEVGFEVAHDPAFKKIERTGAVIARPELGHAVHVELDGLAPARDYWFRFLYGDAVSPTGRTKTAPASGDQTARLRFASCGCSHLRGRLLHRVSAYGGGRPSTSSIMPGDYIYEAGPRRPSGPGRVRHHRGGEPYTLDRLSEPLRALQVRSGPDGRPCLGAVRRLLGRSRGRQ